MANGSSVWLPGTIQARMTADPLLAITFSSLCFDSTQGALGSAPGAWQQCEVRGT